MRDFAVADPRGFLAAYAESAIIDEIQQAPELRSCLLSEAEAHPDPDRFIFSYLFGSQRSIRSMDLQGAFVCHVS